MRLRESLVREVEAPAALGQRVAFTNGCFDVLHAGHVQYLQEARAQADLLVVGLNSDASVRALKGPGRPVNPVESRALVLAALEAVDYLTVFDEATPLELIQAVRPDVLVKGADYRREDVVGAGFRGVVRRPRPPRRAARGPLDDAAAAAAGSGVTAASAGASAPEYGSLKPSSGG